MKWPCPGLAGVFAGGLAACGDGAAPGDTGLGAESCGAVTSQHTVVISQLSFTRRGSDGTAHGFDLDGVQSADGDSAGCGHADLTSPTGEAGIDSAFSGLVPVLEGLGASAVEGLVQDAVDSGELLLILELQRLDDWSDDACVDLEVSRGAGTPLLGTDGVILVDQSFSLDPGVPASLATGGTLRDGTVEIRGVGITLPVQILDVFLTFDVPDSAFRFTLEEDGTVRGYFAGGVPVSEIVDQIGAITDIGDLAEVIPTLVQSAADLYPDETGVCTHLSLGFDFVGTPTFIIRD